ncbi:ABC transporter permease [Brevibacterium sp. UMB1308A]|uniref:ABC transporter permease n=1 Tax=Brevibacterium sp. UMB1308A TaxID=3050608 RepID=UPI002549DE4C|nr:ABC transporter permease [Brevibacterium sp. UMB1308A]MDK8346463.1 ABC transporter permease [Brevibacterium sp. UMB1308B]MDK8714566.1 ABC transporter permease [Brevibacterium sp. UMB1308A]
MIVKANLRSGGSRLIAAGITVMVSVAFVVAVTSLLTAFNNTMRAQFSTQFSGADLLVTPGDKELTDKVHKTVASVDGVKDTQLIEQGFVFTTTDEFAFVSVWPKNSHIEIEEGKAPSKKGEILYDAKMAEKQNKKVGDTVEFVVPSEDGESEDKVPFTISGLAQVPSSVPMFFATDVSQLYPEVDHIRVFVDNPADTAKVQEAVAKALAGSKDVKTEDTGAKVAGGFDIYTVDQIVQQRMKEMTGEATALVAFIAAFIIVALFVAGLVISNTFQVLIASRTRTLALLRAVGATRSQLRNATLAEGAVLGLISSVLGVFVGWGFAVLLTLAARAFFQPTFALAPLTLLAAALGLAVGVTVTVIASFWPALKATRVSPIDALAPVDIPAPASRFPWIRLVVGTLLTAVGVAALLLGAVVGELLLALPGGILAFSGVLVLSRVFVPPMVAVIGRAGEKIFRSPTLGLVARNVKLSPRRTASTTSALLVGVTLVATILVGAQTTRVTANDELNRDDPIDVVATSASGKAVDTIKKSDAVDSFVTLPGVQAKASVQLGHDLDENDDSLTQVVGVDKHSAKDVPRDTSFLPKPGTVNVRATPETEKHDGKTVDLKVGNKKVSLTLKAVDGVPQSTVVANKADVADLGLEESSGQTWARVTNSASAQDISKLQAQLENTGVFAYADGAELRAQFSQILNIMTGIVLGLLATSVVISIVGVGNTLSLATMERKRETALLRAMGMSRWSAAFMVAAEAVLMALTSLVVGLGLGILFGWTGVRSLLTADGLTVPLGIPWLMFGAVAVVALVAALAASVVPAITASRTQPAQGVAMQ